MARVTTDEVIKIVDEDIVDDSSTFITPFINTANLIVTEVTSGAGYSDAQLKDIELWLTAHFLAVKYNAINIKNEDVEGVKATYHGASGMGLDATQYGQMAKLIDVKGRLARLGKKSISLEVFDVLDGGT